VDSQSWILSAAFKLAQLPGHYVMRLANREYACLDDFEAARQRFAERLQQLWSEEGFYVKDWTSGAEVDMDSSESLRSYVENLVDVRSNENVHNRACHNLWVYNFEARRARQALSEGRLEQFVASRLMNTRYRVIFEDASPKRKRFPRTAPSPHPQLFRS
jgi:hypothetical protein